MQNEDLMRKISAILFLYNEPITFLKIKELLNLGELDKTDFEKNINELILNLNNIGLTIIKNENKNEEKSEYSLAIINEFSDIAKKIRQDELEGDLTPASLQVLTICAYLGASTKNEISFIRGVQSSQSIRSLSARGLIKKVGERYNISTEAMQKLGISKLEELPEYEKIKTDFTERLKEVLNDEKHDEKDSIKDDIADVNEEVNNNI